MTNETLEFKARSKCMECGKEFVSKEDRYITHTGEAVHYGDCLRSYLEAQDYSMPIEEQRAILER